MFRKILTASVLIVVLLVSTMGINLHKLYCICLDKSEISLFEFEKDCPLEKSVCSKDAKASCCKKPAEGNPLPCKEKKSTYLKIGSQFDKPLQIVLPDFVFTTTSVRNLSFLEKEIKSIVGFQKSTFLSTGPPIFIKNCVFRC
ncbi:MAG: hypothetical protein R2879_09585 [Saprospiraceae bacterium]